MEAIRRYTYTVRLWNPGEQEIHEIVLNSSNRDDHQALIEALGKSKMKFNKDELSKCSQLHIEVVEVQMQEFTNLKWKKTKNKKNLYQYRNSPTGVYVAMRIFGKK